MLLAPGAAAEDDEVGRDAHAVRGRYFQNFDVGDEVPRPRGRLLSMGRASAQARDAQTQGAAVLVEMCQQMCPVEIFFIAIEVLANRAPVTNVVRHQCEPVFKLTVIEQPVFVDEDAFEFVANAHRAIISRHFS